jgi:hypothetical protein
MQGVQIANGFEQKEVRGAAEPMHRSPHQRQQRSGC